MFPVPRSSSSSSSPYSLPWTFKLFSIAIPRPLTRLIFSFLMHFFPPNDLWTARFVVGFVANQKVITPWSVFLFFFSFFRKISFLGSSCRCSKSLAMMDWRKSSWIIFVDETSRYSSLSSSVLQFDDVRLFHRFLYYRVLRMAKYGVPGSNIFSFFSASGNLPLSQMYREHGSAIGKGWRTIFHSERSPPRWGSETGAKQVARQVISASANVEGAIVSRKWEIIEDVKEFVANFVFSRASWMPISGGGGGGRFSWECIKIRMINRWRYIYFFS